MECGTVVCQMAMAFVSMQMVVNMKECGLMASLMDMVKKHSLTEPCTKEHGLKAELREME